MSGRACPLAAAVLFASLLPPCSAAEPAAGSAAAVERLGDEAARVLGELYAYDASAPLEARVVERVEKDGLAREKIVFRGVQGFLASGYLQLPAGTGPHPCVLLLHGWSGSKENWWQTGNYISGGDARTALLAAGLGVLALDAQCHGDRIAANDFAPVNHYADPAASQPRKGYFTREDIYVQTVRDYRRAIDYLATRGEIDTDRIGVLGYSMGGTQTYLLAGVEPRIKAAVAVAAPAERSKWSIVAPQNFVCAIGHKPLLAILGSHDEMCSPEQARALHALFPQTSEQIFLDAGHKLPPAYVAPAAAWLKRHLQSK
jgi:dienelactone hydrolase